MNLLEIDHNYLSHLHHYSYNTFVYLSVLDSAPFESSFEIHYYYNQFYQKKFSMFT